jgi:hypothetical protein
MASTIIKDILVQKLADTNNAITECDNERLNLESLVDNNKARFDGLTADKAEIIAQLQIIDPTGVYE